ncbi:MAG TPA: hypothetical protein VMD75_06390 [Candidatus Binataceae bacterium]|jgi:hypothetical protein|nr:hypothetical protein [Candidatus Binataceae bacterium]
MKQPQSFPSEPHLPSPFRDLEPHLAWALESERERVARRLASSIEELRAFYDAMLPRLESIAEYLNQFALDEMPGDARRLLHLAFSWTEIASAVEIYRQPTVINGLDPRRFIPVRT